MLSSGAWSWLQLLIGAYLVATVFAFVVADRMMYLPPPPSYSAQEDVLRLALPDGTRIAAVHLSNPSARHTILYSHGNAEDLGHIRPILEALRDIGFSVLAYDYRGYGASEGRPGSRGARAEVDAAYDYLLSAGVRAEQIIAYGRSLGGGPAVDLASRRPVGGLVLESTFVSAYRVLTRAPILPFDRFRNLRALRRIGVPVLVVHGTEDRVIPVSHGERLFAAAAGPKRALWVEGAGHNDLLWVAGARWAGALVEFAASLPTD